MSSHRGRALGAICLCVVVFFGFAVLSACGSDDTDTAIDSSDETDGTPGGVDEAFGTTTAVTTGEGGMIFDNAEMGFVPHAEVTMDDGESVMLPIDEAALAQVFPDEVAVEGVKVTVEWVDSRQLITGRAD